MSASASSRIKAFAALAALLVSGCATMPESVDLPELSDWQTRSAVLTDLDQWAFRGRIAVKTGDDGMNGKFDWDQSGERFAATVSGPLGMGTVRIAGDPGRVIHTDKDGVETVLEDVEAELYYRYGWTIPVESLRFWALGVPDPAQPAATTFAPDGLLERMEQGGWIIDISRYDEGGGQLMPRILSAKNAETRVRIVIDRWSFPRR